MAWPASVITREISFGKAVVLETGQDLSLRVSTRASRSLVSLAEGFRMEALVAAFETSEPGDEIVFPLPVTNQPGWADAATRQGIEVGDDEHSHLYTTTLTIYNGSSQIRQYTIGPYPVPQGEGVLDGDTMLVPSGTQPGALVPLPEIWEKIIADANAILNLRGEPNGIATLDEDGLVPKSEIPMQAIADSTELSATIADAVAAGISDDVPGLVAQYAPKAPLPTFKREPSTILTAFQSGHGWTTAGTGATWTEDTTVFAFGSQSLKVVTGSGSTANVTKTGLTAIDGTERTFRLWVHCDDWTKVHRINLLVSSDSGFSSYFNLNVFMAEGEEHRPYKNGEWVPIEYSWADLTTSGSPTRTALTAIRVLIAPQSGQVATVNVGLLEHIPTPAPFPSGVLTYTFDDSWESAYTIARAKLSSLGHPATLFPINGRIDEAGYLTSEMVAELVTVHGWEFGAHADTHANHVAWDSMNQTQRLAMLNAIKQDQNARGFNDSPSFAYPNGRFPLASMADVRQFYSLGRRADGAQTALQTPAPMMSMRVSARQARQASGGGLSDMQAYVDDVVAEKGWGVIVFHDLVESSPTGQDWLASDFDTFADYVASSGVAVATMQDVLRASAA